MLVQYMGGNPVLEHEKRDKIRSQRGSQRHYDQRLIEKGQRKPHRNARNGGEQRSRGLKHCGNQHCRKNRIRDIMKEPLCKTRFDFPTEQGHRKHTDQVGCKRHCNAEQKMFS